MELFQGNSIPIATLIPASVAVELQQYDALCSGRFSARRTADCGGLLSSSTSRIGYLQDVSCSIDRACASRCGAET